MKMILRKKESNADMRLFQIYFSPTGGTKKIVDFMSRSWDCEKVEIDLSDSLEDFSGYIFGENDVCMVAAPVFGGRVPMPATSNIRKLKGNGAKAVLIAVYGNRAYEDALLELKNTAALAGFCCIAGVAAVAQHSIMNQFAAGRPDLRDEEELLDFSEKIKGITGENTVEAELWVPGNDPYKEYKVVPVIPKTGDECNQCGLCAEECPAGAIPKENPMLTEPEMSISCMRCVVICPQKARYADEGLVEMMSKRLGEVCSVRKENELFLLDFAEE